MSFGGGRAKAWVDGGGLLDPTLGIISQINYKEDEPAQPLPTAIAIDQAKGNRFPNTNFPVPNPKKRIGAMGSLTKVGVLS